jgi:hypothetical protein
MELSTVRVYRLLLIFLSLSFVAGLQFNLAECEASLQSINAPQVSNGLVDGDGNPTQNVSEAQGYTYDACLRICGSGIDTSSENTTAVVGQLTVWFLPYLTLLAQVPFFTEDKTGDIIVSLLTIGAPTLALYSLFLTLFNWRRIKSLMSLSNQDEMERVLPDILGRLQQYPMTIDIDLLSSALAFSRNRKWWVKLRLHFRDRSRRLDGSGVAQLFLAGIVYIFAVVEALSQLGGVLVHIICH